MSNSHINSQAAAMTDEIKTVLVTGCTGFIGAQVTGNLLNEGYKIYAIVRDKAKLAKLPDLNSHKNLEALEGDLLSDGDLNRLQGQMSDIGSCDAVIHMIGGGPLTSNAKFAESIIGLNYKTTVNLIRLLEASQKLDCLSLFVYFSSLAAMGIPASLSNTIVYSESTSCNPVLFYEQAKLQTEDFLREVTEKGTFKTVVLRFPQVYGGDSDSLVQMTSLIRRGTFPVVRNRIGTLPLLHVADAAKATCMVVRNYSLIERKYDVNVVCEGSYSYADLDALVRGKYGTGRIVNVPYALLYLMVLSIEIMFKLVGKPEPLNRRRLLSMTKHRIVDCKKFVQTFNFHFDHNLPGFMCDSLP